MNPKNYNIKRVAKYLMQLFQIILFKVLFYKFFQFPVYGLLGNRNKTKKLTLCKSITNTKVLTKEKVSPLELLKEATGKDLNLCLAYGIGHKFKS